MGLWAQKSLKWERGQWLAFSREKEYSVSEKLPERLYKEQKNKVKNVFLFTHRSRRTHCLLKAEKP